MSNPPHDRSTTIQTRPLGAHDKNNVNCQEGHGINLPRHACSYFIHPLSHTPAMQRCVRRLQKETPLPKSLPPFAAKLPPAFVPSFPMAIMQVARNRLHVYASTLSDGQITSPIIYCICEMCRRRWRARAHIYTRRPRPDSCAHQPHGHIQRCQASVHPYLLVKRLTTHLCIPSLALCIAGLPLGIILLLPAPRDSKCE